MEQYVCGAAASMVLCAMGMAWQQGTAAARTSLCDERCVNCCSCLPISRRCRPRLGNACRPGCRGAGGSWGGSSPPGCSPAPGSSCGGRRSGIAAAATRQAVHALREPWMLALSERAGLLRSRLVNRHAQQLGGESRLKHSEGMRLQNFGPDQLLIKPGGMASQADMQLMLPPALPLCGLHAIQHLCLVSMCCPMQHRVNARQHRGASAEHRTGGHTTASQGRRNMERCRTCLQLTL